MDKYKLQEKIEEVNSVSGSGTALISLYISSGSNIMDVRQRMIEEQSEADNIKSKSNKKNVQSALNRVERILRRYDETPENGLVIFAGVSDEGETVEYVFDSLPNELNHSDYTCDSKFVTDELQSLITPQSEVGLLVLERGGANIGSLRGTQIIEHYNLESGVKSQHTAGGFSDRRWDRRIEEEKEIFFQSVSEKLKSLFVSEDNEPKIDNFVIGGPKITVSNFISNDYLSQPLQNIRVGGVYSVNISSDNSLERLADKAESDLEQSNQNREIVNRFFESIHSDSEHATYGKEHIETALDYGAIDTLLLSENLDISILREFQEKVENQGGELVTISRNFEKGEQFWKMTNGYGALLRYQIE